MRLFFASALFATALATTPALGQSKDDQAFLTKDVQGARYELALAKLAETKASRPQVRSYARMIAHDHASANAALIRLTQSQGVKAPTGMTSQDAQTLAKLKALNRAAFDKAYLDEVTRINSEDAAVSEKEKSSTQDPKIRAYLAKYSAMDEKHKKVGEDLKAKFG